MPTCYDYKASIPFFSLLAVLQLYTPLQFFQHLHASLEHANTKDQTTVHRPYCL